MTYHLSSEQYQRGIDLLAAARLEAAQPGSTLSRNGAFVVGQARMLSQLAGVPARQVMRDSDARLADLGSPLTACAV